MGIQEEIDKAIGAHGLWKGRLKAAIASGKSDFKPEVVSTDNNCDFGKWLYSSTTTLGALAETIKKLHADFHKEAGRILKLALSGQKAEAEAQLNSGSAFTKLSTDLVGLLMKVKRG